MVGEADRQDQEEHGTREHFLNIPPPEYVEEWTELLLAMRQREDPYGFQDHGEINDQHVDFTVAPMSINEFLEPFVIIVDYFTEDSAGRAVVISAWQEGLPHIITSDSVSDCSFTSQELLKMVSGKVTEGLSKPASTSKLN